LTLGVFVGQSWQLEGIRKAGDNFREQLQQKGLHIRRSILDQHANRLKCTNAKI
jgi:hypothetical protein